jgi:hypothetical protein
VKSYTNIYLYDPTGPPDICGIARYFWYRARYLWKMTTTGDCHNYLAAAQQY